MKFYYENNVGDSGYFEEEDLIKEIYTAWNIEANLYKINPINVHTVDNDTGEFELVFMPYGDNEFNSTLLKDYGYYMTNGDGHRCICKIDTDEVVKYDWSEVEQLI